MSGMRVLGVWSILAELAEGYETAKSSPETAYS